MVKIDVVSTSDKALAYCNVGDGTTRIGMLVLGPRPISDAAVHEFSDITISFISRFGYTPKGVFYGSSTTVNASQRRYLTEQLKEWTPPDATRQWFIITESALARAALTGAAAMFRVLNMKASYYVDKPSGMQQGLTWLALNPVLAHATVRDALIAGMRAVGYRQNYLDAIGPLRSGNESSV